MRAVVLGLLALPWLGGCSHAVCLDDCEPIPHAGTWASSLYIFGQFIDGWGNAHDLTCQGTFDFVVSGLGESVEGTGRCRTEYDREGQIDGFVDGDRISFGVLLETEEVEEYPIDVVVEGTLIDGHLETVPTTRSTWFTVFEASYTADLVDPGA